MIDWSADHIHDIIGPLQEANKLAYKQFLGHYSKERTKEILEILESTQEELEELINELREEP